MSANPNQPSVSGRNRDPNKSSTYVFGTTPINAVGVNSPALQVLQDVFARLNTTRRK